MNTFFSIFYIFKIKEEKSVVHVTVAIVNVRLPVFLQQHKSDLYSPVIELCSDPVESDKRNSSWE